MYFCNISLNIQARRAELSPAASIWCYVWILYKACKQFKAILFWDPFQIPPSFPCFFSPTNIIKQSRDLLTTLDWLVKMAYWSSYDTTENSSSDVQWTVIVSYEAVHNSSRITGGFGATLGKTKRQIFFKEIHESSVDASLPTTTQETICVFNSDKCN